MQRMQGALGPLVPKTYGVGLFQPQYFDCSHVKIINSLWLRATLLPCYDFDFPVVQGASFTAG
jgi:hypothetical protein